MSDTKGIELPDGRIALSEEEIAKLKIKIGKKHRTEKDWAFIKELLEERAVFTANPMDEKIQKKCCVEGLLKDNGRLVVFTSLKACKDYLDEVGTIRYGRYMTIGNIPFRSVLEIAVDYGEKVYIDPNDPTDMKILAIDGKTQTLHVYRLVKV